MSNSRLRASGLVEFLAVGKAGARGKARLLRRRHGTRGGFFSKGTGVAMASKHQAFFGSD
jgi:hypothetical protein